MSLMQQGSQVARKSVANIPRITGMVISESIFISRYDDDAQVPIRTCRAWGIFVFGIKKAMRAPRSAAGLTMYQSSIKPR